MTPKPETVHVDKLDWMPAEWADEGVVAMTATARDYVLEIKQSQTDAREWKASVMTPQGELQSFVIARSENGAKRATGTIVNAAIRDEAKAAREAAKVDAARETPKVAPKPKRTRKAKATASPEAAA